MMQVFQIREEKRALIPAVTHVDGSGRLQTVHRGTNPLYYKLFECSLFVVIHGLPPSAPVLKGGLSRWYSSLITCCACCSCLRAAARRSKAARVNVPCFRALLLPLGSPEPRAPPCMRQTRLPFTAGARQGSP